MDRFEYEQRSFEMAVRGSRLPQSKLNEDTVRVIRSNRARAMAEAKKWTAQAIAARYGMHVRTIEKVLSYETWRHVRGDQ